MPLAGLTLSACMMSALRAKQRTVLLAFQMFWLHTVCKGECNRTLETKGTRLFGCSCGARGTVSGCRGPDFLSGIYRQEFVALRHTTDPLYTKAGTQ